MNKKLNIADIQAVRSVWPAQKRINPPGQPARPDPEINQLSDWSTRLQTNLIGQIDIMLLQINLIGHIDK